MSTPYETYYDAGINLQPYATGQKKTICPQCSHLRKKKKDPCLSVNATAKIWNCKHCGWAGYLISAPKNYNNKEYKMSQNSINHSDEFEPIVETEVKSKKRAPSYSVIPYQYLGEETADGIISQLPQRVITFFNKRGINEEVLYKRQITFTSHYIQAHSQDCPVIAFPYFLSKNREVVNIKYRDACKHFSFVSKAPLIPYGLENIPDGDFSITWVEGEMDSLSMDMANIGELDGIPSVVLSVPAGAPKPEAQNLDKYFQFIHAFRKILDKAKQHIIAVDSDDPGQKLQHELTRIFPIEKCKRVRWPNGCKDANDVLVLHGVEMIRNCIDYAKPFPIKGLIELEDFEEDLEYLYHHGFQPGEHPGWESLASHYTVKLGELTLVVGIPGAGKSSFIDALCVNLAMNSDWNIAVCSPEMLPPERHTGLYIEKYTGKPFSDDRNCLPRAQLDNAKIWFSDHFCFVIPDDNPSLDEIFRLTTIAIQRKNIKGLIIDPWSEINHENQSDLDQGYYSRTLSKIRTFARKNNIHIWLVVHPTKLQPLQNGEYAVPTPYSAAGSAHFRNKVDNAITVFLPNTTGGDPLVEIHIQKIKFREVGKVGKVKLRWNRLNGRYSDVG